MLDIEEGIGSIFTGMNVTVMLKGRVVTSGDRRAAKESYVGAVRLTKNTAELQAIVEALLCRLSQLDTELPIIAPRNQL